VIPTPPDLFDEWIRLPVEVASSDPRFEVRRARPEEFERVYDVVDAAFGKKRSRAHYDWLYRANPFGRARCWIVIERATGAILKTGAGFPWPIWRGSEALKGALSGDSCAAAVAAQLAAVRRAYAGASVVQEFCASPVERGSRIVTVKAGQGERLSGALRGNVLPLRAVAPRARQHPGDSRASGWCGCRRGLSAGKSALRGVACAHQDDRADRSFRPTSTT
jgi:hypothetical protein